MMLSMPRGTRTLALADPRTAWTEEAYLLAYIFDLLYAIGSGLGGKKSSPPTHKRPQAPRRRGERRMTHSQMLDRLNGNWREIGHARC